MQTQVIQSERYTDEKMDNCKKLRFLCELIYYASSLLLVPSSNMTVFRATLKVKLFLAQCSSSRDICERSVSYLVDNNPTCSDHFHMPCHEERVSVLKFCVRFKLSLFGLCVNDGGPDIPPWTIFPTRENTQNYSH